MTIPVADHGSDGILDVTSHFFEFIPEKNTDARTPWCSKRTSWKRGTTTTSC